MASASELISYQGNPLAAMGSNTQIPVTTTGQNGVLNQTARDLMLLNHENNVKLYQQKVKDRDTLYSLLAEGQASVGAIRDEDRQVYKDAKSDANDAFMELARSGGVNNPDAMKKYKEKVGHLNQVATQAQARYKLLGDEEKEIAAETRPLIREERQKNLDPQKKEFWSNYQPYQKAYDYDVFKMRNKYLGGALEGGAEPATATTDVQKVVNKDGKITTTNVQKTVPLKGKQPLTGETVIENGLPYNVTKGGRIDFGKIMNNVVSDYQENKDFGAEDQRALLNGIEQLPVAQQQEYLGNLLKKAQQYNNENGFKPDENGNYPEGAINIDRLRSQFVPRDTNDLKKGYHVALTPPELTALDALASLDSYVEADKKVFDKDVADAMLDKEGLKLKWAQYGLDKKKMDKEDAGDLLAADGILKELTDSINNGEKVIEVDTDGKKKEFIEISDPTLLKTFSTIDKDGKVTNAPDAVRYDPEKDQAYLMYFDKNSNGDIKTNKTGGKFYNKKVPMQGRTWANLTTQRTYSGKDKGNVNELVQGVITKAGSLFKLAESYNGKKSKKSVEVEVDYNSLDPNGFKQEGSNWRYKDGTLFDSNGKVIKK